MLTPPLVLTPPAVGQAVGLPLTMTAFAFIGLAVTSATAVLYGRPVSDPVALMALLPGPLPKLLASGEIGR